MDHARHVELAQSLDTLGKRFLLNASAVKPKTWSTIRRHAKIPKDRYFELNTVRTLFLLMVDHIEGGWFLSEDGEAVKAILQAQI